jgi:hypothetical protein
MIGTENVPFIVTFQHVITKTCPKCSYAQAMASPIQGNGHIQGRCSFESDQRCYCQ